MTEVAHQAGTVRQFLLPDLGEGLEDAEVVAWHVQVGGAVAVDQVVAEVETAKAVVEVPVPFAGIVTALHAAPGDKVLVGQPLISVAVPARGEEPGRFSEPGTVTPDRTVSEAEQGSGSVLVGYGTGSASRPRRRRVGRAPRPAGSGPAHQVQPSRGVGAARVASAPAVISPLVRKLARDRGLDLAAITGTGPFGVIRRSDVERALQLRQAPEPAAASASEETRVPLRGVRRAVAEKLARSRREIPEATIWVDVDATNLLSAREALNAERPQEPVSLLALLARFTIMALRRYPELNARIDAEDIVIPSHVHLGFAAQTDRGLVVPVVRDAHRLSTRQLSAALAARTGAARAGTLSPAELTGSTITVNNYGVFGVDGSAAIINHPEVAIVGMGRIIDRPWVVDGQLTVRKVCQLTLAFDHRVCDGGTAGGFLRMIADCVENPVLALGEL